MMLAIDSVDKTYRGGGPERRALSAFTLDLAPGVLGLLGPNGAGKSTLMRILATVTFGIYPNLSATEFLQYLAAVKGLDARLARQRIAYVLDLVNLADSGRQRLGGFSGGMRQRVGIAQALLNDPRLLIVDEPTVGLDPEERVRFRNLLSELAGERVVILSTHIVSDVEATATAIAIIDRGRLVTHRSPESLLQSVEGRVWEWLVTSAELPAARQRWLVSGTARRASGVLLRVVADEAPHAEAVNVPPSLEDAYLKAMAGARPAPSAATLEPSAAGARAA
jgi:ABC-type multidrug transport system ATPase subunit